MDIELKRQKLKAVSLEERIKTLEDLNANNQLNQKMIDQSMIDLVMAVEKQKQENTKEVEDIIESVNLIVTRGPKGDKNLPVISKQSASLIHL